MNLEKLLRNKFIFETLRKKQYPSLATLLEKIETNFSLVYSPRKTSISETTLKRNFKEIESMFGVNIEYSAYEKGYYIEDSEHDIVIEKALESLNLFYLMKNTPNALKYIRFDTRKASGIDLFFEVLSAIEEKKKIRFFYKQYEKNETTERKVSPLGLKAFKGFWYLVAKDKDIIKVFGLDRITGLSRLIDKADYPKDFSLDEYFKHCYGIVRFPDDIPQEILIKMKPIKAEYYKANPLHHSQRIVEENQNYVIISLYVYYTYDLKQELRSHLPNELEIIKPQETHSEERYY
jgi:hypothetical protein